MEAVAIYIWRITTIIENKSTILSFNATNPKEPAQNPPTPPLQMNPHMWVFSPTPNHLCNQYIHRPCHFKSDDSANGARQNKRWGRLCKILTKTYFLTQDLYFIAADKNKNFIKFFSFQLLEPQP